jgi:hypothetical protein
MNDMFMVGYLNYLEELLPMKLSFSLLRQCHTRAQCIHIFIISFEFGITDAADLIQFAWTTFDSSLKARNEHGYVTKEI